MIIIIIIDVDVVHQAIKEVNQTTSPQSSQDTTQRAQSTIQTNLLSYEVFPTEIKNKTREISVTKASVMLLMVFTMKLSISGEIFSMYYREGLEKPL